MLQAQAPACVHLAGRDEFGETLRAAEHIEALQQLQQCRGAQFPRTVAMGMELANQQGQLGAVARHLAAFVDRLDQVQSQVLMGDMPWPLLGRRQALADIVQQAGPAHAQRLLVLGTLLQHAEYVHAGVDLRVVRGWLRHAEQGVDLRQQGR